MTITLMPQDFDEMKDSAISSFGKAVQKASLKDEEIDFAFSNLESKLAQIYGFVAKAAKRESEMDEIAELWHLMITICDGFLAAASEFTDEHERRSDCYNNILAIREKSEKLYEMHR